jgi:hypothetical protein
MRRNGDQGKGLSREQVKKLMERVAKNSLGTSASRALQQVKSGQGQSLAHAHLSMLATALKYSKS